MDKSNGADRSEKVHAQPKMKVLGQFMRDLSFENFAAQQERNVAEVPSIAFNVQISTKESGRDIFSVSVLLSIDAKSSKSGEPIFLLELDYGGRFLIENSSFDQLKPHLLIECPKLLFPYIRRLVEDLTGEGGFPPLKMDPIDFAEIYKRKQEQALSGPTADS
ncbi:MAG: protein-export chaperone SecB [Albidovulum sp.]|nr:protein-export chaperone SecB [Albidovulum sp.]MDE0307736.1 protein-export chaperone SecB [Albidovulum sp.]